jgi:hypothetical protein
MLQVGAFSGFADMAVVDGEGMTAGRASTARDLK